MSDLYQGLSFRPADFPAVAVAVAVLLFAAGPAAGTQMSGPSIASQLPDVRSITPANAAGVLQYCRKQQLVGIAATDHLVEQLTSRRGLLEAPLYAEGMSGQIVTGQSRFALDRAAPYMRTEACNRVFRQAKLFDQ
jgi:hypothetical protein